MNNVGSENFLTDLMGQFKTSIVAGATNILPEALLVLGTLATIELAISLVFNKDQDPIMLITERFLKFGFSAWLISNWVTGMNITKQFFDTFQNFGVIAALGSGGQGEVSPGAIAEVGIHLTDSLSKSIFSVSTAASVMGNMGLLLVKIAVLFIILACFCWMALQLFVTCIEFYITSTITVILLPFSVCRFTSFVGEKAWAALISFCIKVMALQFILCLSVPVIEQWTLDVNNADLTPLFRSVFGCLGVAFLTWKAPDYIQGLLSGTPSFGAGDVVGGARAAVGGATAVASAPMRIAGFTQAAMNAPGGRNNNGSTNWSGTASNMGTMLRQRMPDRQSELHNQVMFSNAKAMLKQQKARDAAKNQTNLFD